MPPFPAATDAKAAHRKYWRQQRQRLGQQVRAAASASICRQIVQSDFFLQASHLAAYWPLADEVDLRAIFEALDVSRQHMWLPRVTDQRMSFASYRPGLALDQSTVGTRQPSATRPVRPAEQLDLVLLPLLAYTRSGVRLGMGGGFYDRTFSFMLSGGRPSTTAGPGPEIQVRSPLLVGVAFAAQQAQVLPADPWDVPLHHIVTESEWITCRRETVSRESENHLEG